MTIIKVTYNALVFTTGRLRPRLAGGSIDPEWDKRTRLAGGSIDPEWDKRTLLPPK